jgi:TDG/mug DNA glycosylase family protein
MRSSSGLTLPDLLHNDLEVVFVGINPSVYSAERGHYFARGSNRFWPCISRSTLTQRARTGLRVEVLAPQNDRALLDYGIGFTDLVKRPTPKASDLTRAELVAGVDALLEKIARYRPQIACFHGITGYRFVHNVLTGKTAAVELGLQDVQVGVTRLYLVPNPSGANAHFSREDQTRWYDALAGTLGGIR